MRKLCISLLCAGLAAVATPVGANAQSLDARQRTIVYIDGVKYYVHTVAAGETLYSLSRLYGVDTSEIVALNPAAADGLRIDSTLKIPVSPAAAVEDTATKKRRKDFEFHTVAAGETLYSISRSYEISIDTVLEDNPGVDPAQLAVGTRLYIRKAAVGSTHVEQVGEEWENYRDNLNSVAPEGYFYYIVQPGETLYSLSRRFEISEEEILRLNAMPDGLKAGAILILPSNEEPQPQDEYSGDEDDGYHYRSYDRFEAVDRNRALRVALLLPMSRNGNVNQHYMDFYRGFLLGAESVKNSGYSVELTLFDTEQSSAKVERLVENELEDMRPDLIVGPVYENGIAPVVRYAERENIPVVSPLAALNSTDSRVLFQMSPDGSRKYDKIADLFDGSRDVTLIYGETTDREFEREVLSLLKGRHYATHKYLYEHQSVIERRAKNPNAASGPGDMTVLLRRGKNNVFVVLSDNETEVDRILAALASADISLRTRERFVSQFVVFGSSKWNRYSNLDSSIFFRDGLVSLSSYSARRDNDKVRDFDDRYITDFGAMPSPYSYRGYDAAVIFGTAMFGDIEHGMEGRRYVPLQTGYTFERIGDGEKIVNTEWMRTDYRDNFTIKVE